MKSRFRTRWQLRIVLVIAQWLLAISSRLVRPLALGQRYRMSDAIAGVLVRFPTKRLSILERNYGAVLRLQPRSRRARNLARASMQNYGRMAVDFLALCSMRDREVLQWVTTVHSERFFEALDLQRGIILVLSHLGSWDVAAAYAQAIGCRLTVVTENNWTSRLAAGARESRGITLAPLNRPLRELFRTLARTDCVAILCDVAPANLETVDVPFFGHQAPFPTGPARLALRTGAPILVVSSIRLPNGHYELTVEPLIQVDRTVPADHAIRDATATAVRYLERNIAAHPEQWYPFRPVWGDPA